MINLKPLVISDFTTLDDTERALELIAGSDSEGLQLPKHAINKRRGALHDAARLQALITWGRRVPQPFLQFHNSNPVNSVVPELSEYAPGIAAMRFAHEIRVGNHIFTRREALEPAVAKMAAVDAFDLPKMISGRCVDLTCVSGAKVQYLRPLFSARRGDAVKKSEGMHQLFRTLSNYINKDDAGLVPDSLLRALGIFSSELFSNTQEHATSDERRAPYSAHVEGVIVSWSQLDDSGYSSDFQGHPRLVKFWKEEAVQTRTSLRALRCLQLSFFDSGAGFAARSRGVSVDKLSLPEERAELIRCLQKNATSKREPGAGHGLPAVLTELEKCGGLIRIRSGRQAIFNVFDRANKTDPFDFDDWGPKPVAAVAGSVVSLIIPLRKF